MQLSVGRIVLGLVTIFSAPSFGQQITPDKGLDPWVAEVDKLPRKAKYDVTNDPYEVLAYDWRRMPDVGNGYIGHVVFSDSVFMNGIYVGDLESQTSLKRGTVYRAQIPAYIDFRVNISEVEGAPPITREHVDRLYRMDFKQGYFEEHSVNPYFETIQRVYAHQRYVGVLVVQLEIRRKTQSPWLLALKCIPITRIFGENPSPDINFAPATPQSVLPNINSLYRSGIVASSQKRVHVYYTPIIQDINIDSTFTGNVFSYNYLMAVDESQTEARLQFEMAGKALLANQLFTEHIEAWAEVWRNGSIEFDVTDQNGLKMAKRVHASYYYLMSSLPPLNTDVNPHPLRKQRFWGVGDGGIGRGGKVPLEAGLPRAPRDFEGLISWFHELMMLPAVLPFYPEAAELMLKYRRLTLDYKRGGELLWAAMCARSVLPANCDTTCKLKQKQALYLPMMVGYAGRQFVSMTGHQGIRWLSDEGNFIFKEIGLLVERRIEVNKSHYDRTDYYRKDYFDIPDVMGPDEYHHSQLNNMFTNALALVVTNFGSYAQCLTTKGSLQGVELSTELVANKTRRLYLPFWEKWPDFLHSEFDGFFGLADDKKKISWADTILVGYPVILNMSEVYGEWHNQTIRWRDLEYYQRLINLDNKPIASALYGIGWMEVDAASQSSGELIFRKLEPYCKEPFYVWSDSRDSAIVGNANYLPIAAAYIQMILNGYLGMRIRPEALDFLRPKLPPDCTRVHLRNIKYRDSVIDINITDTEVRLTNVRSGEFALMVYENFTKTFKPFKPNSQQRFTRTSFYINATQNLPCFFPRDSPIWGYNPYINGARPVVPLSRWPLVLLVAAALQFFTTFVPSVR